MAIRQAKGSFNSVQCAGQRKSEHGSLLTSLRTPPRERTGAGEYADEVPPWGRTQRFRNRFWFSREPELNNLPICATRKHPEPVEGAVAQ